jgi:hypothetical protein
MADKVLHEIRFIETDDGFRVEVKGDKERLKEMGWGPGMDHSFSIPGFGFMPGRRFWRKMWHGPKRHRKHGPGVGFGPWNWWGWMDDESDEDEEFEKPVKDA